MTDTPSAFASSTAPVIRLPLVHSRPMLRTCNCCGMAVGLGVLVTAGSGTFVDVGSGALVAVGSETFVEVGSGATVGSDTSVAVGSGTNEGSGVGGSGIGMCNVYVVENSYPEIDRFIDGASYGSAYLKTSV